jgi:hypothetical protein
MIDIAGQKPSWEKLAGLVTTSRLVESDLVPWPWILGGLRPSRKQRRLASKPLDNDFSGQGETLWPEMSE